MIFLVVDFQDKNNLLWAESKFLQIGEPPIKKQTLPFALQMYSTIYLFLLASTFLRSSRAGCGDILAVHCGVVSVTDNWLWVHF